jgi:hypothetical protein
MTVQELVARFPEIPPDLHGEPLLAQFAETFEELLQVAQKPSACSAHNMHAGHHYYLKLVGPMDIYRYGLSTREKVIRQVQDLLDRYQADPSGFAATLLPPDMAETEVKGPGCS